MFSLPCSFHKPLFSLSLAISVQRIAPVSVSLAFGTHSCANAVNATIWGAGHLVALCVSLPCSFHKPLFSLSLAISVQRIPPISVSLAFGPHSCASTVNATVEGWPSGSTVCFTPMLFPEVLNAKQGNSMRHIFFKSSVWLDWVSNPDLPCTKRVFYHRAKDAVLLL